MARTELYTRAQFLEAYESASNMLALKRSLNCSAPTLYRYLRKFGLPPLSPPGNKPKPRLENDRRSRPRVPKHNPVALARRYTYRATLPEIAEEVGFTSQRTLIYYLKMLIKQPRRYYLSREFPPPKKICHIKIINYLIKRGTRRGINPNDLVELLNLNPVWIQEYWEPAFGLRLSDYDSPTVRARKEK